jgi:hypothetical protein
MNIDYLDASPAPMMSRWPESSVPEIKYSIAAAAKWWVAKRE